MFADDERDSDDRSADTVADGSIAGVNDDETGLFARRASELPHRPVRPR
jgi:hypothetical protein